MAHPHGVGHQHVPGVPAVRVVLSTSVVALLVSEACDIGLAPVVNSGYEAPRARLVHVDQHVRQPLRLAGAEHPRRLAVSR
ncbi:hypothetical protein [Streptoalloteichus hindustanus]|uniref:Uncharacterized protein n=1 Tax=Streptoalloteichus hindustanus TaxID=2017 RepID=A0A1M5M9W5_STRHI|nr:hypothetical protein [Streptoalloteichus hindustanus]SHG74058.1 hypothetical protein SAMN05444320_11345 [Streptoalloteichus hindustanus]